MALLFISNRSPEVQAAIAAADRADLGPLSPGARAVGHMRPPESPRPLRMFSDKLVVHDVSDDQIKQIRDAGFKQLHSIPPPENFDGLALPVIRGNGVYYQRHPDMQELWNDFQTLQADKKEPLEDYFAKDLEWDGDYPKNEEPKMTDEKYVNNKKWVQFKEAKYPIELPPGTKHVHCFIRGPVITPTCFDLLRADEPKPAEFDIWQKNLPAYIKFINAHDYFGTTVELTESARSKNFAADLREVNGSLDLQQDLTINDEEVQAANEYRKAIQVYLEKMQTYPNAAKKALAAAKAIKRPHLERAKRAMQWATRHINRLAEAKFPDQKVNWFTASPDIRSYHLAVVHMLVEENAEGVEAGLHAFDDADAGEHAILAVP